MGRETGNFRPPDGRIVAMNIGEMQRSLSCKAEKAPNHRFGDLFNLLHDKD
jgi:hypothetical protein